MPTYEPVRVAIVLDVADDPYHLYVWAGARAAQLVVELRARGLSADPVGIDIEDFPDFTEGR